MQSQGGKESWPAKLGIVKKGRPAIASAAKDEYFRYDPDNERFSMIHRITPQRRDTENNACPSDEPLRLHEKQLPDDERRNQMGV